MKKLLIWLFCVAMLLSVAACGDEQETEIPGSKDTATSDTVTTPTEDTTTPTEDATTTTTTTKNPDGSTNSTQKPTGSMPTANNNEVNWENFFGDTTTTTTKKPTGSTTGTKKPTSSTTGKPTTTTTTKPTTTTTLKPTTIDKVSLPAEGTDLDPQKPGRIKLTKVALKSGVVTFTVRNMTDQQKQKWITEETNYIAYACYDKDGKQLKGNDAVFGYLYIGCLEAGEEVTFNVTLPKGTTRVAILGSKIVYWTPWS